MGSLGAYHSLSSLQQPRMLYLPCQKATGPGSSYSKILDNISATESPLETPHAHEAVFKRKKEEKNKRTYTRKILCGWTQVILDVYYGFLNSESEGKKSAFHKSSSHKSHHDEVSEPHTQTSLPKHHQLPQRVYRTATCTGSERPYT